MSRSAAKIVLAALLAASLAACGRERSPPPEPPPEDAGVPYRVKVVDADELVVDGVRVRLANADAPDLFPAARCWAEAVLAKEAYFDVRDLVEQGRSVVVRSEHRQNRWGQTLAEVSVDGVDIGDWLYERGLAARPTGRRFAWCGELDPRAAGAPRLDPLFAVGRR